MGWLSDKLRGKKPEAAQAVTAAPDAKDAAGVVVGEGKPGKLANQLGPEAREEIAGAAGNGDAAVLPREEAKKTILIKFKTPNGERQLSVPIGVDVIGYAIREFSGEFGTVIVSKEPNSNIYEIVPEQAPPEQGASSRPAERA